MIDYLANFSKQEFDEFYKLELQNWWYIGKNRIITHFINEIKEKYHYNDTLKILDLGCGIGVLSKQLSNFGEVIGADISYNALSYFSYRNQLPAILLDGHKLSFKKSSFDLIVASELLEHLEGDDSVLEEMYYALKPKGVLIITVPANKLLWGRCDISVLHKRRYLSSGLISKLKSMNFDILKSTHYNFTVFPLLIIIRAIERLFIKKKYISSNSALPKVPSALNYILKNIQDIEFNIIKKGINFPFGVNLAVVTRK